MRSAVRLFLLLGSLCWDSGSPVIYQPLDQRGLSFDWDFVIFTIHVGCQTQILFPIATSDASFFGLHQSIANCQLNSPDIRVLPHPCHSWPLRLPHSRSLLVPSGAFILPSAISLVIYIYTLFSLMKPVS